MAKHLSVSELRSGPIFGTIPGKLLTPAHSTQVQGPFTMTLDMSGLDARNNSLIGTAKNDDANTNKKLTIIKYY